MPKEYKDATPAEKYASAVKQDKDKSSWNPGEKLMEFIASKTGADKPVPPTPPAGLPEGKKKGGKVGCGCKKMAKGGTASSRADGCAQRGKTRGRYL